MFHSIWRRCMGRLAVALTSGLTPRRSPIVRRSSSARMWLEELEARLAPASGSWTSITSPVGNVQGMMLQSDGSGMLQGGGDNTSAAWYRLAPNASGSYINGAFSTLASMSVGRLFFTSDVLPSGKVFVLGGEYSSTGGFNNTGEIYDPVANSWSPTRELSPRQFWRRSDGSAR